jgi:hypothetical protein
VPSCNKYIQQSLEVYEPQYSELQPFVMILIPLFWHLMPDYKKLAGEFAFANFYAIAQISQSLAKLCFFIIIKINFHDIHSVHYSYSQSYIPTNACNKFTSCM